VRKGEGEGTRGNACRQTHDFEKPIRPRTEFPDWRGMVVLVPSDKSVNQIRYVHLSVTCMNTTNWYFP